MTRPRGFTFPGSSGCGKRGAVALGMVAAVAMGAASCGGSGSSAAPAASTPAPAASTPAPAASTPVAAGGLHFPAHLFGLNLITGREAQQAARGLKSEFSVLSSVLRSPQVAFYGTDNGPDVTVVAARWSSAGARQVVSAGLEKRLAGSFAAQGATGVRSFPAGPHGGALLCGHKISGVKGLICLWADKLTFGFTGYLFGTASSLSDAATKTKQVQSAIGA